MQNHHGSVEGVPLIVRHNTMDCGPVYWCLMVIAFAILAGLAAVSFSGDTTPPSWWPNPPPITPNVTACTQCTGRSLNEYGRRPGVPVPGRRCVRTVDATPVERCAGALDWQRFAM